MLVLIYKNNLDHLLIIKYVGYKNTKIDGVLADDRSTQDDIVVEMVSDEQTLGEVKVTGMARKNTDVAMIEAAKLSSVIVNNISAQEIKRTQDNNASEVIRRVQSGHSAIGHGRRLPKRV